MTDTRKEEIRLALNTLMNDDAFLTALFSTDEPAKYCELLKEKGIIVSPEEIQEMIQAGTDQLIEKNSHPQEELNEEDLELVAGGGKLRAALRYAVVLVGGAVAGAALGLFVGAGVLAVGTAYGIGAGIAGIGALWTIDGKKKKGW